MAKKRDKEISLSEKLSLLIQTKPPTIESDDDDLMTVEKIAQNENDSDYSADELNVSKFRSLNEGLLEDDDKKYSGKGVSRKDLDSSADSDFTETEDIHEEISDSLEEGAKSDYEDREYDDESGSESAAQSSESEANDKVQTKGKSKQDNFNKEIFQKAASDMEKGRAIKNQLHIWDFLLECRMKLQKSLVASNQFPNHKNFPKFKNRESPLFQDSVNDCKKSLKHLLNSFLSLQKVLLNSNDEFLDTVSNKERDPHDEDISSETDRDENIKKNDTIKRLKKLEDFSAEISKMHETFQTYRNNTIQKWNDKTRIGYISNKNFSAFEQSALKQIEHVLLDKQRLIKRTQTKRSDYHILGEDEKEPPLKKHVTESNDDPLITSFESKNKGLHREIFDDDDFYHQLLSEMVKRKANDITDPVQLGRQWMQLQKIRSKMKKSVDTKSSKGRKVRFVVHPKLVNFMMPIDNSNYKEESKIELFNSLFGKTKK